MKKIRTIFLPLLVLIVFFAIGMFSFRDYGATPDEKSQIEAGHIYWRHFARIFGFPTPAFENLPPLEDYYNRYYGQAVTFPTVIVEALWDFKLDSSTIIRLRHLWNFLNYCLGFCAFAWLVQKRFKDQRVTALALICAMMLPRFFSDAFGNDRDTLFCAWLWISLAVFQFFSEKPGVLRAVLCAFVFALCSSVRYFGLILLIPLVIWVFQAEKKSKKYAGILTFFWLFFAYVCTPLAWKAPFKTASDALTNFISGTQRTQETENSATLLFLGKDVLETELPLSYVPVWMIVTIPPLQILLAILGMFDCKRKTSHISFDLDKCLSLFFFLGLFAVIWIRPVLYNGWRHFYWLALPIEWFAAHGVAVLMRLPQKALRWGFLSFVILNLGGTAYRMVQEHPYEGIYFSPWMRSYAENNFDRDYWRLSTPECLRFILKDSSDELVQIGEYNGSIDNLLPGMLPQVRDRFLLENVFSPHRDSAEYLIFNYSNFAGNEKQIPFYEAVYAVERDGFKLAEVFRRDHSKELDLAGTVKAVTASSNEADASFTVDGDPATFWHGAEEPNEMDELRIDLSHAFDLSGLTLLPGADEREYARSPEIAVSSDGREWRVVPYECFGLLDYSFQENAADAVRFLRIRNERGEEFGWSVKELRLYGEISPL